MKIAILQCDDVLDKFQTEYSNYPEMIMAMLKSELSESRQLQFKTFDVRKAQYPDALDDFDLFIITGSKASAYDEELWIKNFIVIQHMIFPYIPIM